MLFCASWRLLENVHPTQQDTVWKTSLFLLNKSTLCLHRCFLLGTSKSWLLFLSPGGDDKALAPFVSCLCRSRRQEAAEHRAEEYGDRPGGGDEELDDAAGEPGVHRRQHEQLQLGRKVSGAGCDLHPPAPRPCALTKPRSHSLQHLLSSHWLVCCQEDFCSAATENRDVSGFSFQGK